MMEQIAAMIRSSELKASDWLPSESELAKSFGTSRSTIREAISGLKALGLIESVSGKGHYVSVKPEKLTDWDALVSEIRTQVGFIEAIEARRAIEGGICLLAAERAASANLAEIKAALDECRDANTPETFRMADFRFHLALAKASMNSLFIHFIDEAFLKLAGHYWAALKQASSDMEDVFRTYYEDHKAIYQAIREKDGPLAKERMQRHIERVDEHFRKHSEGS